jgi:hypothetical protein
MTFKNLIQVQKDHEETIKYVHEVIEKSWETLNMMEEREKQTTMLETSMITNAKQIEEVKMLSEIKEPLLDLDKCSLNELINIRQKFSIDPSINVHQAGFGSYIANYAIEEKIEIHYNEPMIPPNLGMPSSPKY